MLLYVAVHADWRMLTAEDWATVAKLCHGNDLLLILDSRDGNAWFSTATHHPPCGHAGMADRTITIGCRQRTAMIGVRVGWIVLPQACIPISWPFLANVVVPSASARCGRDCTGALDRRHHPLRGGAAGAS
jgi:aspartate/methionine/tyrosine aminotransferase